MRKAVTTCALVVAMAGCNGDAPLTRLDPIFGVCGRLPEGASYRHTFEGIDYSLGTLETSAGRVDVYFGFAPNFPLDQWQERHGDPGEYVLVGEAIHKGKERVLLANWRYRDRGPLVVMFSGSHLGKAKQVVLQPNFLEDCGSSKW